MNFRHEIKHYINAADVISLRQKLKFVASKDKNSDENGQYKVRSLYFDNIFDKALKEKIDGLNKREKFRIRFYNDNYDFINLEKKYRMNNLGIKKQTRLTKQQCESIINLSCIEWMKVSEYPLLVEFYSKLKYQQLRPKTIVDYNREAYTFKAGNVRITIDSNIKTGYYSKDLFNPNLIILPIPESNSIILEVKYDEYLPSVIKDIVQLENRSYTSFSKYRACRLYG